MLFKQLLYSFRYNGRYCKNRLFSCKYIEYIKRISMGKQKLSPGARARKIQRDICYAKGWVWNKETGTCSESGSGKDTSVHQRKQKKAENQRIGQKSDSDIHHVNGEVGNTKRVSTSENRDTFGSGDREKKNDKK